MTLTHSFHPHSTPADRIAEQRAILTRAADQEARRQAARQRGDVLAMQEAEGELRRLWRRFGELGAD